MVNQANPKLSELKVKEKQIDTEIEALMSKLTSANDTLMVYINKRIQELDESKKAVQKEICELTPATYSVDAKKIRDYLDSWDKISFDDKRAVVDLMIEVIRATADTVEIVWRPNTSP